MRKTPESATYGLTVRQAQVGCSDYHVVAASTNSANIKASAGRILGWNIFNNALPHLREVSQHRLAFSTGMGISIVKGITDADTTVLVASDCVVDIQYK